MTPVQPDAARLRPGARSGRTESPPAKALDGSGTSGAGEGGHKDVDQGDRAEEGLAGKVRFGEQRHTGLLAVGATGGIDVLVNSVVIQREQTPREVTVRCRGAPPTTTPGAG